MHGQSEAKANAKRVSFIQGEIDGVLVRPISKFVDERGWLAELFRHDELKVEQYPVMAYISQTEPHTTRGPHEHTSQTDLFCFLGPSNFKLRMWDNREKSATYRHVKTLFVGEDNPQQIIVPCGIVHAYRNIGTQPGIVINCPNRLFMGEGKRDSVDEIRHEVDPESIYRIDD